MRIKSITIEYDDGARAIFYEGAFETAHQEIHDTSSEGRCPRCKGTGLIGGLPTGFYCTCILGIDLRKLSERHGLPQYCAPEPG